LIATLSMSMDRAIQNSTLMQSKIQGTGVCFGTQESLSSGEIPSTGVVSVACVCLVAGSQTVILHKVGTKHRYGTVSSAMIRDTALARTDLMRSFQILRHHCSGYQKTSRLTSKTPHDRPHCKECPLFNCDTLNVASEMKSTAMLQIRTTETYS
jgi:hypothetical protein